MKRWRNLILDLDGTLIDSSDGVVAAVNYSLQQMGEPPQPADRIKAYIGYPLSAMYPAFTDKPVAQLYAHFQAKAAKTVISSTVALPGADEVLRELHRDGYRLAIATTKIKRHLDGILAALGWSSLVVVGVGGDEVPRVKPDPMIMYEVLRRIPAPADETMVVGDTENDILAARAVPMAATGVFSPYGGQDRLRASDPDYLIEHISDLPALLERLNGDGAGGRA